MESEIATRAHGLSGFAPALRDGGGLDGEGTQDFILGLEFLHFLSCGGSQKSVRSGI